MTGREHMISVLAAPLIDPSCGRVDLEVPEGLTLAEIVALALPGAGSDDLDLIRLCLVTRDGNQVIEQRFWHMVRPRPGVHVVIRIVPGKDSVRSILALVVAVAATALSTGALATVAGSLGTTLGIGANAGTALVQLGVTALGNLAINALIPPPEPEKGPENTYTVSGWRNRLDPDGAVPVPMGQIRYAPTFAARPYTQIINDKQHIVSLFLFGIGHLKLTDFRIGESSIAEYDEVEIEVREGLPDDLPVTIMPKQVVEETVGTNLTRLLPRDDLGEIEPNEDAIEKPITRSTGADASGVSVIFAWPTGLGYVDDKGRKGSLTQDVRIEHRLAGAEIWQTVVTLSIRGKNLDSFYRQHTWDFPSRGRWEVRITMMTDEHPGDNIQQRAVWAAIQTRRPEYPINASEPLALVALRIRATEQINGQLDDFNALVSRVCDDWDHVSESWVERETSNPASLYRFALQSAANAKPVSDEGIDLDQCIEFHDFCRLNDLKYDRVMDDPEFTLRDALSEIAAAGRASPRHDGIKWGVTIDRPQDLVIDHINPRNSKGFRVTRSYFEPPEGFRIKFKDATNDYRDAERLVPWPGFEGEVEMTEQLQLPGKTDPDEIYREARRRMYEATYRTDSYEALQDGPARVSTRGDMVMASHHIMDNVQVAGRVTYVAGKVIEIDEEVTLSEGEQYAIRFRVFDDVPDNQAPDTIGRSVIRLVSGNEGETQILTLSGEDDVPARGDLIHFGPLDTDSLALIVRSVEAGEEGTSQLYMIDAAPQIDEMTAAEVIPGWSGRVGAEIDENLLQPSAPRFSAILTGVAGTGETDRVEFQLEAGSGPVTSSEFTVEHRLSSAGTWTDLTIPVANSGGVLDVYAQGDEVEMKAFATSQADVDGPSSATVTFVVGEGDVGIPAALDSELIEVIGGLGNAQVIITPPDNANLAKVQIYRSRSAVLDRETDAAGAPIAVSPFITSTTNFGDVTRANLLGETWTLGGGWVDDGGGTFSHETGASGALNQPFATGAGKYYRLSFELTDLTASFMRTRLSGGSNRDGDTQTTNGAFLDRIQAVTGNDTFNFAATSTFVGTLTVGPMYLETASCLDQGVHYIWVEPQNSDDLPGPVSGPFAVSIV